MFHTQFGLPNSTLLASKVTASFPSTMFNTQFGLPLSALLAS